MERIKFSGKDKKDSTRKAVRFYYDNYENEMSLAEFLAKCRFNPDTKILYFYPKLNTNDKESGGNET